MTSNHVRFIDLFAGIGGMRLGLEQACSTMNITSECVFTSEIKPHAIKAYKANFDEKDIHGDISKILSDDIPDFDILLAGFPCQPFSTAGNRAGFVDTRGTLFFEIERILEAKRPSNFILENVEGLITHDRENKNNAIGRTFRIILDRLQRLDYYVSWALIDSCHHGIPQSRKRVYIVGSSEAPVNLKKFHEKYVTLSDILETNLQILDTPFTQSLLRHYEVHELQGKSIKDKRGGSNNIHSWDIEIKGSTTNEQKNLLKQLLKQRRRKHWATEKGIKWMDGMPLTIDEIKTFYHTNRLFSQENLESMLKDLVEKGYLVYEHPKDLVPETNENGVVTMVRRYAEHLPKGYNIVTGKLSFEISKILDSNDVAPTLVATDVTRLAVVDGIGVRRLTIREGLRLFGFPESYDLDLAYDLAYDLLGNTVVVPVIKIIAERMLGMQPTIQESDQYVQNSLF